MNSAAAPSHLAVRRRLASLRPTTPGARPTARPAFSLADVVSLAGEPVTPRALDVPKVQANHRLYLPDCLGALGWRTGQQVRVWADTSVAVITAGTAGRGKSRTVGSGERMTVPAASMAALGAQPGGYLVALVPPGECFLLLLGPAALAAIADLLVVPPHVRDLVERLAGLDVVATRALERLAEKLSAADLVALAGVSVERLHELGLIGAPGATEEVR